MSGRIRTLKPEWLEDELLASSSDAARLLSVALILLADDHGRGRASPQALMSGAWMYHGSRETLAKVDASLDELVRTGFVRLYTVEKQRYFEIRNWDKHQRVQHKGKPRVPAPSAIRESLSGESPESLAPDLRSPITDHDQGSPTTITDLEPDLARGRARSRETIAEGSDDPWGIAPPGDSPDAYPGSVEPLTLSPPTATPSKPKSKKAREPRLDLDPTTLSPEIHAAYVALRDDPTLGPITARPAEAARDLAAAFPALDLAKAIVEIGGRMREKDRTDYKNGPAALRNWLPNSRCFKPPTRPAPSSPAAPAPSTYRRPVGDGDPVDEQIAYFVRRGWQIPPPLLKLQAEERAKEAAAKEAAAAADAPPVVGPRTTPLRDDEETPF